MQKNFRMKKLMTIVYHEFRLSFITLNAVYNSKL